MAMMNKTIYLKIFVNYLQVISLSKGYNLNWPGELVTVFKVQGQAGQIAQQILALDCFISSKIKKKEVIFIQMFRRFSDKRNLFQRVVSWFFTGCSESNNIGFLVFSKTSKKG